MAAGQHKKPGAVWTAFAIVVALVLVGFLQLAVVGKVAGPNPRKTVELLGDTVKVDYLIAFGETLFIIALLLLVRTRVIWAASVLMFGGFAGYAGYYLFVHDGSCGCFGSLIDLPPWTAFAVDVFAVVAGIMLLARRGVSGRSIGLLGGAGAVLMALGFFTAMQTAPPTAAEIEQEYERALQQELQQQASAPDGDTQPDNNQASDSENPTSASNQDGGSSGESDDAGGAPSVLASLDEEARALRDRRIAALGTRASAPERLIRAASFADVMGQPDGGPAWYVFVYDPACSVCMEKKPDVDYWQAILEDEQNEVMRIRIVEKSEAEAEVGIDFYGWTGSPVVFLVRDGVVTNRWINMDARLPEDVLLGLELGDLERNFP